MKSETKNCQNCKKDFVIESEDFNFYEKIKVPPPTFCPECRMARRLVWRNERSLYKRGCDLCNKNIISMYSKDVTFPVYCPSCWKSDKWDPYHYGADYDFAKPFFTQFKELYDRVPRQSLWQEGNCLNVEYANFVQDVKNVYLAYSIVRDSENVAYSSIIDNSKQVLDSFSLVNSERMYESIGSAKNYNCKHLYWSTSCIDSNLMLDCANCQDCFGCVNLRNKKYCIWNEQYTPEEYKKKITELDLSSAVSVKDLEKKFWQFSLRFPRKYNRILNSINSVGDEIRDTKNSFHVFNSYGTENVRYGYRCIGSKDSMDISYCANTELAYEHAFGGADSSNSVFFIIGSTPGLSKVTYSDSCNSSSELFGCIGIRSGEYSILNKKYKKEQYNELLEKIIKHMKEVPYLDKKGRMYKYGEFFPAEFSPFGYNETVADELFPLSKEKILELGYHWTDKKENQYTITTPAKDLPDSIEDVEDAILNEAIGCAESGKAFKLTQYELQFYKQMKIPLPRLHPDIRYEKRMKVRNPIMLCHRQCMNPGCNNEFQTSYAPDRPEKVYCESCYNKEVY